MALENLPVWPFEANWSSEVRETLEWMTNILVSPIGAEQRRTLRNTPRRSLEFEIVMKGRARAMFDRLMMVHGAHDWYLPIWHDAHLLSFGALAGTDFLPCETAELAELTPGDPVFVSNGTPFLYEVNEVESISASGITTVNPLSRTWVALSRIHSVKRARFTDQPEVTRLSDDLASAPVRFMISADNPNRYSAYPSLLTGPYRGFSVLVSPPDENEKLPYGYERRLDEFDNQTGIPYRVDTASMAFPKQKYAWVLNGRLANLSFLKLAYELRGRALPIWLPTFFQDFELAEPTPSGEAYLVVENCMFTALGGATENRKDLCIELINGGRLYRRIVSSTLRDDGREIIAVDTPFADGLNINQLLRISFMALSRLDQDTIEVVHKTDSAGISLVDTTFRSAPDLRIPLTGF